jgi:hypothetical protein
MLQYWCWFWNLEWSFSQTSINFIISGGDQKPKLPQFRAPKPTRSPLEPNSRQFGNARFARRRLGRDHSSSGRTNSVDVRVSEAASFSVAVNDVVGFIVVDASRRDAANYVVTSWIFGENELTFQMTFSTETLLCLLMDFQFQVHIIFCSW